jgi:formate hydrogenlyase subunit 3/multisubunit Na+/H+ antiporter MnhD subunit
VRVFAGIADHAGGWIMTTALLWIGLPLLAAVLLWLLQARRYLTLFAAAAISFVLMFLAWVMPVDSAVKLGPVSLELSSTLAILGRRFVLTGANRPLIMLIFGLGGFWFLSGLVVSVHRFFAPLGLAMIALLVAAVAVEPFLYSALLVEMAVLVSIPLLSPPGRRVGKGVLRYLTFQTMAMPFILFAGWVFGGVEINPADRNLLVQSVVLLGLGFAFWLGVFPLYTWIPLMSEEVSPITAGFVLSLLTSVILILSLDFMNGFPWLWQYPFLATALRLMGVLMAATGGAWAIFERNLNRLLGYAVIIESGYALLALSLGSGIGLELFAMLFLPRLLALLLWSTALHLLAEGGVLNFEDADGLLFRKPFAAMALLLACFSMGGLPLLAGFPLRLSLLQSISVESTSIALWSALGSLGLLLGAGRTLFHMVKGQEKIQAGSGWLQNIFLLTGSIFLALIGIFPGLFLPAMLALLDSFSRLR